MAIYQRHETNPQWEPFPWDAQGSQVVEQELGFHRRALKPLVWTKINWLNFPEEGIFGHDREWFSSHDIAYVATFDDEELVLIQNTWHGFPDPPEWRLASRSAGNAAARWQEWGHFPRLPEAWLMVGAHCRLDSPDRGVQL
jgi:hypothetical protein